MNMPPTSLHDNLVSLINQLEEAIHDDVADGTIIPGRYETVAGMLDDARQALDSNDHDTVLEILGSINLDALDKLDDMDDTIGAVIVQLRRIHCQYGNDGKQLPSEILRELEALKKILHKYDIVSQTSH